MTKDEILNGMSEQEFYSMYPTKEAWEQSQLMAYGGMPDLTQYTFGNGITMQEGGTPYYGGPIYPAQNGTIVPAGFEPAPSTAPGIIWNPETGKTLKDPIAQPVSTFQANGVQSPSLNPVTQGSVDVNFNKVNTKNNKRSFGIIGQPQNTMFDANSNKLVTQRFGGLPGGANEMPCMNCGGYMKDGGNSSPFNYGQFPAMQGGGDADMAALWLAQEQLALQNRTKQGLPQGVKPTGTNPLNFNPFLKGSDINQPDSMHTNPYDPRIAAYFKGSKMIAGPAENTGPSINAARKLNVGKMYKKDDVVYPNYRQAGGNFQNDGSYPMMNQGGIDYSSTINDVFSKYQKKSGGDITSQGGNQDYITNMNNAFKGAIQRNVINKFNQDERDIANQVTQQATQEVDQAYGYQMGGGPGMSYGYNSYDAPNLDNQYRQQMYQAKINNYNDQHALDKENMRGANLMLASNIDQNLAGQRESEAYWNQFSTPKAQKGMSTDQSNWDAAMAQQEAEEAQRTAAHKLEQEKALYNYTEGLRKQGSAGQNSTTQQESAGYENMPWFKQLATEFGPQGRNNGLNYFPANMRQHYQMNKAGKEAFMNLPENFKTKGLEVTRSYGPLGRTWLGNKLGVGAKKIKIKLDGTSDWQNSPYEQGLQVRLSDPTNPLVNPNAEQNPHVILDPSRNNNFGPSIQTTPNPDFNWDIAKHAYGGGYYAQDGRSVLGPNPIGMGQGVALKGAPPATSFIGAPKTNISAATAGFKEPEINKFTQVGESGTDNLSAEADINRKWQGLGETVGQYAIPGINMLASKFEQKDYRKAQRKLEESTLADNAKVTRNANAFDMGTYNPNTGDFRENEKVPVQFPGYNVKYGGMPFAQGGEQDDSWEDDLSEEEIENLKAQGYNIEYLD